MQPRRYINAWILVVGVLIVLAVMELNNRRVFVDPFTTTIRLISPTTTTTSMPIETSSTTESTEPSKTMTPVLQSKSTSQAKVPSTTPPLSALEILEGARSSGTHPFFQPFPFTITPRDFCPSEVKTLFVVQSWVMNRGRRDAIRATYANGVWEKHFSYQTLFVVGRTTDETVEGSTIEEANLNGDLLQIDYVDAYRNMTIKYLNWMRFVRDNCPNVTLVIKIDDDILPHIFWLFEDLNSGKIGKENTITCMQYRDRVSRDRNSPYYVSVDAHPDPNWGTYCLGLAQILSIDLLPRMISSVEQRRYYNSVDDAFMTGEIAHEIGAKHDFAQYANKWTLTADITRLMLNREVIFGAYGPTARMKRVFHDLELLSALVTDPPDNFAPVRKAGPGIGK